MQAFPFGRISPGKSETPPCKSGQLEKDLGLEASSPRHAARLVIFEIMRSFFVGSKSSRSPSGLIQLKPSWCIALTAYCQSRPESCARRGTGPGGRQTRRLQQIAK